MNALRSLKKFDPDALRAELDRSQKSLDGVVLPTLRGIDDALRDGRGVYLDEYLSHWVSRLFRLDQFDLDAIRIKTGEPLPEKFLKISAAARDLEEKITPFCLQKTELDADDRARIGAAVREFLVGVRDF